MHEKGFPVFQMLNRIYTGRPALKPISKWHRLTPYRLVYPLHSLQYGHPVLMRVGEDNFERQFKGRLAI